MFWSVNVYGFVLLHSCKKIWIKLKNTETRIVYANLVVTHNLLYHAPESEGGTAGLFLQDEKIEYVKSHLISPPETNEYQEYFKYLMEACHYNKPSNWTDSLELYHKLLNYAVNGS